MKNSQLMTVSSCIDELPLEVLYLIFSFNELESLQNLKKTSQSLEKIVQSYEIEFLTKAFSSKKIIYNNSTALVLATKLNLTKLVNIFLEKLNSEDKEDLIYLNLFDTDNKTALHYAVENNNTFLIFSLLKNGAKNVLPGKDLDTPLTLAAKLGNIDAARFILNKDKNYIYHPKHNYPPINMAAAFGNYDMMNYLQKMGAKKDFITYLNIGAGFINISLGYLKYYTRKIYGKFDSIFCRPICS